jgi:hypothetical protein
MNFAKPQPKRDLPIHSPGFLKVRPVLNPGGEERFGVIELAQDCAPYVFFSEKKKSKGVKTLTGGLCLSGSHLNLGLANEKEEADFWHRLTASLPEGVAAQYILRRKPGSLKSHYEQLREQVLQRLNDEESAYLFLEDYLENLIYPVEEAGLTEQEFYLLIGAPSEEAMAEQLALLFTNLPCDATPLCADDLQKLLGEYGANFEPACNKNYMQTTDIRAYWTLVAPPPSVEGGWTRPILENEALANARFDIVGHITPGKPDSALRTVLEKRSAALLEMLESAENVGTKNASRDLSEQLNEVNKRLATLEDQGQRFYEVSLCLSLYTDSEHFAEQVENFEIALLESHLTPRRVCGESGLELAWRDCAPINLSQLARPFVVGEHPVVEQVRQDVTTAGKLLQLATSGSSVECTTLAGYSRTGEAFYLKPDSRLSLFLLGEKDTRYYEAAHNMTQYLMAMRFLQGQKFCVFDPSGKWLVTARQLGGLKTWQRPHQFVDLLSASPSNLQTLSQIEKWIEYTGCFLSDLLGLKDDVGLESLLLGAVVAQQYENITLTPVALWERALVDNNEILAEALSRLVLDGDLAWLFAVPTEQNQPNEPLLVFGFEPDEIKVLPETTRRAIMTRVFTEMAGRLPDHSIVVSEADWLLQDKAFAGSLFKTIKHGQKIWAIADNCEELLVGANGTGRWLLEQSQMHLFFRQEGAGLIGIARRLNLPARSVKAIRGLAAGAAIVRQIENEQVNLSAFEPLPGDYIGRLSGKKAMRTPEKLPEFIRTELEKLFTPKKVAPLLLKARLGA